MFIYVFCFLLYIVYCFTHWKLKRIPNLPLQYPFLQFFYLTDGVSVCNSNTIEHYYEEMRKKGYKYAGVVTIGRSVLLVRDLDIANSLMIEGYEHFADKGFHHTNQAEYYRILNGWNWKEMKYVLTPYTLSKSLKPLFKNILNVTPYLVEAIEDCALEMRDIDVKELLACFTTDVITYHCYKINCCSYKRSRLKFCKCTSDRVGLLGQQSAEEEVSRKLYRTIRTYMRYRKWENYRSIRFPSLNLTMKDWSQDKNEPLVLYKMTDRIFHFLYCSFDVCSTTLYFALYELCRNQDIQDKVRKEIDNVIEKYGQPLTWEVFRKMKYLDQVINETLRMYPSVANAVKSCRMKGYKLQDTDVKISMVTDVIIPLFSLHRDPEYYPDPDRFDPKRFDSNRRSKNPWFFMPYGEGPRGYTSIQMSMMQTRIGLVEILRNFKLSISPQMYLLLKVCPKAYVESEDDLYINAEKI